MSEAPGYKKQTLQFFLPVLTTGWMLLPGKKSCRTCGGPQQAAGLRAVLKEQPVTLHGGHFEREKPLQHRRPGWPPLQVLEVCSCPHGDTSAYMKIAAGLIDFLDPRSPTRTKTTTDMSRGSGPERRAARVRPARPTATAAAPSFRK